MRTASAKLEIVLDDFLHVIINTLPVRKYLLRSFIHFVVLTMLSNKRINMTINQKQFQILSPRSIECS